MALNEWVRLPTGWIEQNGLSQLSWSRSRVDALTALMTLIVIAQHADQVTGQARLTYDDLQRATGLSRTTISGGLGILEQSLIDRGRQSEYTLRDYDPAQGWAKLPARALYDGHGRLAFFYDLKRRKPLELDALKFYLLCVSRRNRDTNMAHITYDKIEEKTGIDRKGIKPAISFLALHSMIYVEHLPRQFGEYGFSSAYRIPHVDARHHLGTTFQKLDPATLAPWQTRGDDF